MAAVDDQRAPKRLPWPAIACGVAACLTGAGLALVSHRLHAGAIDEQDASRWLAAILVTGGGVYLGLMLALRRSAQPMALWWIVATALVARLVVCAAPPMLETDFHRYLWDGAVAAHGVNPYKHPPLREAWSDAPDNHAATLHALADEAGAHFDRINHPHLTTIYPPAAQSAFVLTHWIRPFDIGAWRAVLLAFDALTFVLLMRLLRTMALPASAIGWYAWNPLLLREAYSSLHMDILLLPVLAGALLVALRSRPGVATALCVVGSAIKVWPILLAPIVARPLWGRWGRLLLVGAVCAALAGALWSPLLIAQHTDDSGFVAYAKIWQNNDGFFRAGFHIVDWIRVSLDQWHWDPHVIMRAITASLLLIVVAMQFGVREWPVSQLPRRVLVVAGALFLLSPTQFPWYWLWLLPLLTIRPFVPLLLYTALLPLYYIQDDVPGALWIQHTPVWTAILCAGALHMFRAQRRAAQPSPTHA